MDSKTTMFLVTAAVMLSLTSRAIATRCLLSRLEHYPCSYRHFQQTEMPKENQMGVYRTRYSMDGSCEILKNKHYVKNIENSSGTVFYLKSPNEGNEKYNNDQYAIYNINCYANEDIYFNLTNLHLEDATCYDETANKNQCVDYIQVRNPQGNVIHEICGDDSSKLRNTVIPYSSITVLFRTSSSKTFDGFSATAMCFNPSECTSSSQAHMQSHPSSSSSFIQEACPVEWFKKITVPYGHDLNYDPESFSLVLIEREVNLKKKKWNIPPLHSLLYFSSNGSIKEYRDITSFPSPLKGPGILHVPKTTTCHRACCQDYIVDVSNLVPNQNQKKEIHDLNLKLYALADSDQTSLTPLMQKNSQSSELGNTSNNSKFMMLLNYLEAYMKSKERNRKSLYAYKSSSNCNPVLLTLKRLCYINEVTF